MEESSLDTDIDNYSKTDILNLLDLDASASEVERNDAVDNIITNMRTKNNPNWLTSLSKQKPNYLN